MCTNCSSCLKNWRSTRPRQPDAGDASLSMPAAAARKSQARLGGTTKDLSSTPYKEHDEIR